MRFVDALSRRLGTLLAAVDSWVSEHPRRTVAVFALLTLVFASGLGGVSTATGTEQFTSGVPEEQALEDVQRTFTPPFETDAGSTQLIQTGRNVLSKPSLTRMLRVLERVNERPSLRVASTASVARQVALELDPTARTPRARRRAVERAPASEITTAVRRLSTEPGFNRLLSRDFNARSASATATIAVVEHDLPVSPSAGAGQGGTSPLTPIQQRIQYIAGGDITVFGAGIVASEFGRVVGDSLLVVVPAAVVLIVVFLVVAYRDPVDLLLGILALGITLVWTFGFMGLVGIPFGQFLIAVPPLLLAVGIDFGIHAINRYREERVADASIRAGMAATTHQLVVAFAIVTGTTVVGFLSNLSSQLVPIREFGIVASVGIVFTFLVFGIGLPALKVWADSVRERTWLPTGSQRPIGGEGSLLGRVLLVGVVAARRAPRTVLVLALVTGSAAGVAATNVDTGFSQEDFLPPEDNPEFLDRLPEPFRPSEYTITETTNALERRFEAAEDDRVTIYIEGPMQRATALESLARAARNPPETVVAASDPGVGGVRAGERQSILTIVRSVAARDEDFARVVARHDTDGNGIPDRDLETVYDALLETPARPLALEYLSADRRSARVVYTVEADADPSDVTADARTLAQRYRFEGVATGAIVVFQAVAALIFESAVVSLGLALVGTLAFLVLVYWLLVGRPSLAVANTIPIVLTVAWLAGTMVALDIAFNAFTATVLAITIGLGIDYSVHVIHRYVDERAAHESTVALNRTIGGTGGALAGSVLTTAGGIGVLVLAVFPAIGQFGLLTALSVCYSFLASVLVLPSVLRLWERYSGFDGS